jgi:hypothetical protein
MKKGVPVGKKITQKLFFNSFNPIIFIHKNKINDKDNVIIN